MRMRVFALSHAHQTPRPQNETDTLPSLTWLDRGRFSRLTPRLLHLYITRQFLQCNLSRGPINYQDTLFSVWPL